MCPIRDAGRCERGAATTEYSLLLAAVALATAAAIALLGPALLAAVGRATCAIGAGCGPRAGSDRPVDPWDSPDPLVRATWGRLVVLGDSFSSGEGAGDYGAGGSSPGCHASRHAYGVRLARALDVPSDRLVVRACTGATIAGLAGRYADHRQPPQLDGLDAGTSLVALSIGGNDVGWGRALAACMGETVAVGADVCREGSSFARAMDRAVEAVGPKLEEALRQVAARAPLSRVVVLGYPRFFPHRPNEPLRLGRLTVLRPETQAWMNAETDRLDAVVADAAAAAGVEYVDVAGAFAGHELTTDAPWFHGVEVEAELRAVRIGPLRVPAPVPAPKASSFHPTAAGQAALGRLVEAQVRHPRGGG
jgi:lysophospholipase L1-like esterase/Flp pilus assembly pilin Flp